MAIYGIYGSIYGGLYMGPALLKYNQGLFRALRSRLLLRSVICPVAGLSTLPVWHTNMQTCRLSNRLRTCETRCSSVPPAWPGRVVAPARPKHDAALGPKPISLIGSTGSIGTQTLDIVAEFPEQFKVVALAAGSNLTLLAEQARC